MSANYTDMIGSVMKAAKTFIELAVNSGGLGLSSTTNVGWPGKDFTQPSNGPYVCIHTLDSVDDVATIGIAGDNEVKGILQLSLYYPMQVGHGALLAAINAARVYFAPGSSVKRNDTTIMWLKCERSPYMKDDNRLVCHVSLYYRTFIARPSTLIHQT